MDALVRSLQRASGDVVVVAAVDTYAPYADIREYANALFENRGRGIGQRGKDNGLLIVLAVEDRDVWVEVGYDLEEFITDGFAGETSRRYMAPEFRRGNYGAGLLAGVSRIVERVAERRNVALPGVPSPQPRVPGVEPGAGLLVIMFVSMLVLSAIAARLRGGRRFHRRRRWGGGPWSGWHSGVGPFGGGVGGFGGGFGGFGGGRSGGGGGARW
ncbi:MAG: TPM domain-containing protein [Acidobacteria bacterium]|nr:TPM domain-containing protein [Acidobacteriota bacterium]